MTDATLQAPARAAVTRENVYRAVWRWHFYAGLFTLPFLFILAVTGGAYLFRDEIDGLVYADLKTVDARSSAPLAPDALIAAAEGAQPGKAALFRGASAPDAAAEVTLKVEQGPRQVVYVDPYDGRVLGALPEGGSVMGYVRRLHSLALFGRVANALVEIAAGWAIVLVASGVYLWWPRGQRGGVVTVRATPAKRVFWRDLHAVTGAFAGLFIAFLALTGMPWSLVWGAGLKTVLVQTGGGYPSGVRANIPMSPVPTGVAIPGTGWTMQAAPMPQSTPGDAAPLGVDAAAQIFADMGFPTGYGLALPAGPNGVYSASVYPDDVSGQRVAHIDQYSGMTLVDARFADYGAAAKAIEWGISVHMGQEYGRANQLFMLAVCVALVGLCVSSAVMWWKRRPKGSLGVPPPPLDVRATIGVVAIVAVAGVLFPLVGASLLAMLAFDALLTRRKRAV